MNDFISVVSLGSLGHRSHLVILGPPHHSRANDRSLYRLRTSVRLIVEDDPADYRLAGDVVAAHLSELRPEADQKIYLLVDITSTGLYPLRFFSSDKAEVCPVLLSAERLVTSEQGVLFVPVYEIAQAGYWSVHYKFFAADGPIPGRVQIAAEAWIKNFAYSNLHPKVPDRELPQGDGDTELRSLMLAVWAAETGIENLMGAG